MEKTYTQPKFEFVKSDERNRVFLPADGWRYRSGGNVSNRSRYGGEYWSSSVNGNNAWHLFFEDGNAFLRNG